jgi:hypothetical protein
MRVRSIVTTLVFVGLLVPAVGFGMRILAPAPDPVTEAASNGLVKLYGSIADSILANKDCEENIVRAILAVERAAAMKALDAGSADGLRAAATHMGNFATEGGSATAPVRTRLLEGGHHHNADDTGEDAVYDTGYVVLTKKQKKAVLDVAKRCSQAAEGGKADAGAIAEIRKEFASACDAALGK